MTTRVRKKLIVQGRLPEQPLQAAGRSSLFGYASKQEQGMSGQADESDGKAFFSWFWEDVIGLSSESYRRAFWRAANQGHTIGAVPETLASWQRRRGVPWRARAGDALLVLLVIGCPALVFYMVRRLIRRHVSSLRRPTYYERERDRRIALGRQRRAITARRTHNPKPSFEAIRAAWNGARHSPEGALRLGGLLEDLECYVNNHAKGNAATGYRGRYGGIKRLLEAEAPDLFAHYAALMRYKSIARRFRQACGLEDPIPADAVLPISEVEDCKNCSEQIKQSNRPVSEGKICANCSELIKHSDRPVARNAAAGNAGSVLPMATHVRQVQLQRAGGQGEIMEGCGVAGRAGETLAGCADETLAGRAGETLAGRAGETLAGRAGETLAGCADETLAGRAGETLAGYEVVGRRFPKRCYFVEETAYGVAARILDASENSVIALEAALALEIDPDAVTQRSGPEAAGANARDGQGAGRAEMPEKMTRGGVSRRVAAWLRRRGYAA